MQLSQEPENGSRIILFRIGRIFDNKSKYNYLEKPKTFTEFFIEIMKSISNYEYFEKKHESHRLSISEIIDCERGGYLNV